MPEFHGLKVRFSGAGDVAYPGIRTVQIQRLEGRGKRYGHDIILDRPGVIGSGGNSGFQALNLALAFGSRRVILFGYDMSDRSGVHWYGRNSWMNANNPDETNFVRWRGMFADVIPQLAKIKARVINVSSISALKAFPRQDIFHVLREWGTHAEVDLDRL